MLLILSPFHVLSLRRGVLSVGLEATFWEFVKLVILPVQASESPGKTDPAKERKDGNAHVQPHEQWITGQWHEGLGDGRRESMREPKHASHQRPHVLRCFGERVFKSRDAGEDLRECDENVCRNLSPH